MSSAYWERCYAGAEPSRDYDGWLGSYEYLLPAGAQVLDLGCGTGTNIAPLLNFGAQLSAADLSANAVAVVREKYGAQLDRVDCFDMSKGFPYGENRFDAVVSDLSLHYFTWTDTQRIIAGLQRILKPGGRLIARVHSMKNLDEANAQKLDRGYYLAYGCARRYFTEADLRDLFAVWQILSLRETVALRYGGEKQVFEFAVRKPEQALKPHP